MYILGWNLLSNLSSGNLLCCVWLALFILYYLNIDVVIYKKIKGSVITLILNVSLKIIDSFQSDILF